jgi:hypothetical protein
MRTSHPPLHIALLAGVFLAISPAASLTTESRVADEATARAHADRMLQALGGRERWSRIKTLVNDSQQNRLDAPTVVRAVIRMDLRQPRFRIDTRAPGLHLIRVVDRERHWRLSRAGAIEDVPAETLVDDLRWYAGHVYRTIHRIARPDPTISLRMGPGNRLEVLERGTRIAWFKLDADGEPYAFGAHEDEVGTVCGPWSFERDGIKHPIWTARPDGTWRANLIALTINEPLPDSLFARPERPPVP